MPFIINIHHDENSDSGKGEEIDQLSVRCEEVEEAKLKQMSSILFFF